ncbi:patatin-like phospholipase family protein [Silvibacterium acidisoli]|uniref:patatin-like phospholipase family protein n=1 Tax=Acidobacteriaceae bacterium ZG23-2 TaxID=2883246 RepID=UPI00406D47C3
MPQKWNDSDTTFHLAINMAGAVSAGAYTAGVLDFLMEALEQWYASRSGINHPPVPMHDVSIDAFSGASAGGMCAAIAAVMVQGSFQHIRNPADASVQGTTNRFYESWVNKIDIEPLLRKRDLEGNAPVVSLLDSTIIDEIADYALTPGPATQRPYISKTLTLLLTLTNVRGIPYSLNGSAEGSAEENIAYYGDRLQFETVANPVQKPIFPGARPLPLGVDADAWPLLKDAAKATGAFPLFLAPRKIQRLADDYGNSPWETFSDPAPAGIWPDWPLKAGDAIETLNVDGGVTDNDPFQLSHDFLAIQNPNAYVDLVTRELVNPPEADKANCAVLTVAPFPAESLFDKDFDPLANSGVLAMLPRLFTALVSQSRFFGESLSAVMAGASCSRFVLAPSDADHPGKLALQCGLLGAFGGFCERGFRAHDYQLGRRNCQKFLRDHFRLSVGNPVVANGLEKMADEEKMAVLQAFDPKGHGTLPIIPLCGTAIPEIPQPARATITKARLRRIEKWCTRRMHAVAKPLLESVFGRGFVAWSLNVALYPLISTVIKNKVRNYLNKELAHVIAK